MQINEFKIAIAMSSSSFYIIFSSIAAAACCAVSSIQCAELHESEPARKAKITVYARFST